MIGERRNEPSAEAVVAHRSGKKNCAQSIYCGFQGLLPITAERIEAAGRLGGGRADGGRCGALHAALDLAQHVETRHTLQAVFEEMAGSQRCREIKNKGQLSCTQCVELAALVLTQKEHSAHGAASP